MLLPAAYRSMCSNLRCAHFFRPLSRRTVAVRAAKELHFNKNMEALKRMQAGVDKLATVVGVTIGPKVRICSKRLVPLARFS